MQNNMIKIYIFLACLMPISLDAIPYRFTRLVREKHGQIDKVVDFFYDYHRDIALSPKHPSTRGRAFLNPYEQKLYDATLRGFISSLRQLDSTTTQKIGLIWELGGHAATYKNLSDETKKSMEQTGAHTFLPKMGNVFSDEFASQKNKNIVFISSDTYRKPQEINDYFDLSETKTSSDTPLQQILKPMIDVVKAQSLGDQALLQLKDQLSEKDYHYLEKEWRDFQRKLKELMTTAFIPGFTSKLVERTTPYTYADLQNQNNFIFPNISIREYLERRNLVEKLYQENAFKLWKLDTPNFEMLFNVLLSPYHHDIVYAGGAHVEVTIPMLQKMGFKKIVDVGADEVYFIEDINEKTINIQPFRLNPNALRFLSEQPGSKAFNRYLRNPLTKLEDSKKLGHKLVKLFLLDKKEDIERATALIRKDFGELKELVTQAEKSYVDITNIKFNDFPMVEFMGAYGRFAMVEYLMQHGALFTPSALQAIKQDYQKWQESEKEKNQSWYEYFINKVKPIIDSIPGSG